MYLKEANKQVHEKSSKEIKLPYLLCNYTCMTKMIDLVTSAVPTCS